MRLNESDFIDFSNTGSGNSMLQMRNKLQIYTRMGGSKCIFLALSEA